MPQTLLAISAMLMLATYSLTLSQRHVIQQRHTYARELEEMASTVAIEAMEIVRNRAFDRAVVASETDGTSDDLSQFAWYASDSHFEGGKSCQVYGGVDACEALDDFHRMETVTRNVPIGEFEIPFEVNIEVEYVEGVSNERAASPTFHKRVYVYVQDAGANGLRYLGQPIELARTFSYGFVNTKG